MYEPFEKKRATFVNYTITNVAQTVGSHLHFDFTVVLHIVIRQKSKLLFCYVYNLSQIPITVNAVSY